MTIKSKEKRQKLLEIRQGMIDREKEYLSPYATQSVNAFRKRPHDISDDLRPPFAIDRDKIIYSGAYRRYQGKTQVFFFPAAIAEVASNRSSHANYVKNVAVAVGKYLGLNLELLQAIALGHDLGHAPFGHDGEKALSEHWTKHDGREFHHNIQSYYIVKHIAYGGRGLNLTLQTMDGIICHDGEIRNSRLQPDLTVGPDQREKAIEAYIADREAGRPHHLIPWTLEGCVVRISDVIAYIGQDIEDAVRLGLVAREQVPDILGANHGEIMDTLISDLIYESYGKEWVGFSKEVSDKLEEQKAWNYKFIYKSPKIKANWSRIHRGFSLLNQQFMADIDSCDKESRLWVDFLHGKIDDYEKSTTPAEKVKDFMAGMSDQYFVDCVRDLILPSFTTSYF